MPAGWIKIGIQILWSTWWTLVFLANLFEALKAASILPSGWKFNSTNLQQMRAALQDRSHPVWLPSILLGVGVFWQAVTAVFFWIAVYNLVAPTGISDSFINLAYAAGLFYFGVLIILDKLFPAYERENKPWILFASLLISLIALRIL